MTAMIRNLALHTRAIRWAVELHCKAIWIALRCLLTLQFPRVARRVFGIATEGGTTDGMPSLLIVSYYAPPYSSKYGTQRITKFAKYLAAMGWKVVFLVTNPRQSYETDLHAEPLPENVEVVRLDAIPRHPFFGEGVFAPDDFVFCVPQFSSAIERILGERHIDLVLATMPPYSVGLAAAAATVRAGVPLVSDFRDPWNRIDNSWVMKSRVARRLSQAMERAVLKTSEAVVMVSELRFFADYFLTDDEKVRAKTVSIRNGYDDDDFVDADAALANISSVPDSNGFSISYAGVLYNEENVTNILRVLDVFRERYPEAARHLVFEYAGASSAMLSSRTDLPVSVRDHGFLTHRAANLMRARSAVQLFALPATYHAHVSTGKIFEMVRVGVPILALTHPGGTVARLIAETRTGCAFDPLDAQAACDALKRMFDQWKARGHVDYAPDLSSVQAYSRMSLTSSLAEVLAAVVERRRAAR